MRNFSREAYFVLAPGYCSSASIPSASIFSLSLTPKITWWTFQPWALEPLGTDASKTFLEVAPWLVVLFRQDWEEIEGERVLNYYPVESTGIASGMFLMACHQVGLATLTHTPSPMGFLRELLGRPVNEKPYLLIPVGYPADDCTVPDIPKKPVA